MKKQARIVIASRPEICPTCGRPFGHPPKRICHKCNQPIGKYHKWQFVAGGFIEHHNCKNPVNYH